MSIVILLLMFIFITVDLLYIVYKFICIYLSVITTAELSDPSLSGGNIMIARMQTNWKTAPTYRPYRKRASYHNSSGKRGGNSDVSVSEEAGSTDIIDVFVLFSDFHRNQWYLLFKQYWFYGFNT